MNQKIIGVLLLLVSVVIDSSLKSIGIKGVTPILMMLTWTPMVFVGVRQVAMESTLPSILREPIVIVNTVAGGVMLYHIGTILNLLDI